MQIREMRRCARPERRAQRCYEKDQFLVFRIVGPGFFFFLWPSLYWRTLCLYGGRGKNGGMSISILVNG